MEGGGAIELSQKNAIIQEMIEEFLQDWPKESFSLNSGGLRMLSSQPADSSVDLLWSNKDSRVGRASLLYKTRSPSLSMIECREPKERHGAGAVCLTATSPCFSGTYYPTFWDN